MIASFQNGRLAPSHVDDRHQPSVKIPIHGQSDWREETTEQMEI